MWYVEFSFTETCMWIGSESFVTICIRMSLLSQIWIHRFLTNVSLNATLLSTNPFYVNNNMETPYYIVFVWLNVYWIFTISFLFPKSLLCGDWRNLPLSIWTPKNWWSVIAEKNKKFYIIMVIPALEKRVMVVVWLHCKSRVKRCLHVTRLC